MFHITITCAFNSWGWSYPKSLEPFTVAPVRTGVSWGPRASVPSCEAQRNHQFSNFSEPSQIEFRNLETKLVNRSDVLPSQTSLSSEHIWALSARAAWGTSWPRKNHWESKPPKQESETWEKCDKSSVSISRFVSRYFEDRVSNHRQLCKIQCNASNFKEKTTHFSAWRSIRIVIESVFLRRC